MSNLSNLIRWASGDTGVPGLPGSKGDTGAASTVKGDTGTQGDTGIGSQGDTGAPSTVQGDTGITGDTGVGVKGDTGSSGFKGDTGVQGLWVVSSISTATTLVKGGQYLCDTSSAGFNVTLPATPSAGDAVSVIDSKGTFGTKNLVALRNSSNINGSADDLTLDMSNIEVIFTYSGDADRGWLVAINDNVASIIPALPLAGGAMTGNIDITKEPSNSASCGITITATVDTNAEGFGAPLFMAADGHFDTADADADTTSPCVALALETGTGTKSVLLYGTITNTSWDWTTGPGKAGLIYLSVTVGTLTQTQPTGDDDVIQIVGWAISADTMMFAPSLMYFAHMA
jgi:hypothetical protein